MSYWTFRRTQFNKRVRYLCFFPLLRFSIVFLAFVSPIWLRCETLSGTVQDQTGAVISGAQVEITGGGLQQAVVISTDALGKFTSPELNPGRYSLRITHSGFEPLAKSVDLRGRVELQLTLAIAQERINISVPGKSLAYANSDSIYRQLRDLGLGPTSRFDNETLQWDAATFQFQKGTLTLLTPVEGVVTGAIFIGEGHFHLQPANRLDAQEIRRRSGASEFDENFTEVIFRFTKENEEKFPSALAAGVETPEEARTAFDQWKSRMRKRRDEPLGLTEQLLHGETMDNVDADLLAAIYNPAHPPFLNAYLRGKTHRDLRFFLRLRVGALPQLDSPEEVALINYDPGAMDDGVWYLAHLGSESSNHTASSHEDRRLFATERYKIETIISKNAHLFSTAAISFRPLVAGERVLKFALLPNLRVTRVIDEEGQDLHYVQESRKEDGSFYAILSRPADLDKQYSITVQYEGDKVLEQAGQGSFYVRARTSWYPNLSGFSERAIYDLTYKVPRKYKVISVGKLESETVEGDLAVSHWITPTPVAVAGFNYGDYRRVEIPDAVDGYKISGYYLSELPDNLRQLPALETMAPGAMTKYALSQARAQLQLCTLFFGKSPYDEIFITEQPDFAFGQSWPNLVYLPISAYTDSTQRWMLFGNINDKFSGFVQEVTPHEVAHQWWGHAVGWASVS